MFWLAEKEEDLNNYSPKVLFAELILSNDRIHPAINTICAIYLRGIGEDKGYIIPIEHTEGLNIPLTVVEDILNRAEEIFVRDKKQFLYYFNLSTVSDINFIEYRKLEEETKTHEWYYRKYPTYEKVNTIIPLSKHYEKCENIYEKINRICLQEKPEYFDFYNKNATNIFWFIEQQGVPCNSPELYLKTPHLEYSYKDSKIYTQYNLYTTTTRPSNAFNNINFAGLNKEDETRKFIVPQNDFLLEIDLTAYHPTLIAKLINYTYEEASIYEHFSKLLDIELAQAKELTFIFLYKGVPKKYKHLEYFSKVEELIGELWNEYCSQGVIQCPISKYTFNKIPGDNMNPQKLFNYYIQNLETSYNVKLLKEILPLLTSSTKLVMYVYDAFIFDIAKEDKEIMRKVLGVLDKYGLRYRIKKGLNYHDMR